MKRLIVLLTLAALATSMTGCRLFPRWRQGDYADASYPVYSGCPVESCDPCMPVEPCDPCGLPPATVVAPAPTVQYGPVTQP